MKLLDASALLNIVERKMNSLEVLKNSFVSDLSLIHI